MALAARQQTRLRLAARLLLGCSAAAHVLIRAAQDFSERHGYIKGVVTEIIHDSGRGAPLAKARLPRRAAGSQLVRGRSAAATLACPLPGRRCLLQTLHPDRPPALPSSAARAAAPDAGLLRRLLTRVCAAGHFPQPHPLQA